MLCLDEMFCQSWNAFPVPGSCWERSSLYVITNQQLPQTLLCIYSSPPQEPSLSKGAKIHEKKGFSVSCIGWASTGGAGDSAKQWLVHLGGVGSVSAQCWVSQTAPAPGRGSGWGLPNSCVNPAEATIRRDFHREQALATILPSGTFWAVRGRRSS